MNPHGIVPTIIDNGFTLWESKAIVTYIFDKYAKPEHQNFYPRDLRKRAIVDRLLYYDATAFYPSVLAIIVSIFFFVNNECLRSYKWIFNFNYIFQEAIVYKRRKPNEDEYNTLINRLENIEKIYFTNSLFLTGSKITLADVSFFTSLTALDPFGFDYSKFEGVSRFVNSIKETDWFKCENGDYANFCESFSNDLREKGLI